MEKFHLFGKLHDVLEGLCDFLPDLCKDIALLAFVVRHWNGERSRIWIDRAQNRFNTAFFNAFACLTNGRRE